MADGKELDGRVAIVTGAARNIGRAIAHDLAAAGAAVVVNARTSEAEAKAVAREIEAGGGRAFACVADVTDEAAVGRMAAAAVERFGRIDILVNNAAVRREQPLAEMTLAAWREILSIILDGAFICAKACLPQLAASGSAPSSTSAGSRLTSVPTAGRTSSPPRPGSSASRARWRTNLPRKTSRSTASRPAASPRRAAAPSPMPTACRR
jgi:NAD(P)-dependent dehydrogenase (short-subunit alcohol dehydrogenase family)